VVVAADAAAGDDDRRRAVLEIGRNVSVARGTALRVVGGEHRSAHADDGAVLHDQLVDATAESERHQPLADAGAHSGDERFEYAGAGAPDDVEARHRVAVPGRGVAAALSP